jgi:hypothetical protein
VFSEEAWQRVTSVLALSARESEILPFRGSERVVHCREPGDFVAHGPRASRARVSEAARLRVSSRVALVVRVFAERRVVGLNAGEQAA